MMAFMTPSDWKQIEGQRILAGLAAIAALPGAGLVTGTSAGAALFAGALVSVAMAYLLWLFTDSVYYLSARLKDHGLLVDWRVRVLRVGTPFQLGTLAFAGITVVLTLLGFAGEHSPLRGPLSAEQGFFVALGYALVCCLLAGCAQVALSVLRRDVNAALAAAT